MEIITKTESETKPCLFCAETIQAAALKCRFCGEFLNTDKAIAIAAQNNSSQDDDQPETALFTGRPSLLGMVPTVIKGTIFLALAYFLIVFPLEEMSIFQADLGEAEIFEDLPQDSWLILTKNQAIAFGRYRITAGICLGIIVLLVLLLKVIRLKMTYYEVSAERIEWSRGVFDRSVDNLDMFRVVDLRLRRSLLDCIFGIGTVILITTDKTDPEFAFEKVRRSRQLYDIIKKASLNADRENSVIHLE